MSKCFKPIYGFNDSLTGDVSPYNSPVVKFHVPIARRSDYSKNALLELKLYDLIRKERGRMKGLQRIASMLDRNVTDLARRTSHIKNRRHSQTI